MPFVNNSDLPERVTDNLPSHAQDIYREAFNSAYEQYKNEEDRRDGRTREEAARAVAWSAVQNSYEKNESGNWVRQDS